MGHRCQQEGKIGFDMLKICWGTGESVDLQIPELALFMQESIRKRKIEDEYDGWDHRNDNNRRDEQAADD